MHRRRQGSSSSCQAASLAQGPATCALPFATDHLFRLHALRRRLLNTPNPATPILNAWPRDASAAGALGTRVARGRQPLTQSHGSPRPPGPSPFLPRGQLRTCANGALRGASAVLALRPASGRWPSCRGAPSHAAYPPRSRAATLPRPGLPRAGGRAAAGTRTPRGKG